MSLFCFASGCSIINKSIVLTRPGFVPNSLHFKPNGSKCSTCIHKLSNSLGLHSYHTTRHTKREINLPLQLWILRRSFSCCSNVQFLSKVCLCRASYQYSVLSKVIDKIPLTGLLCLKLKKVKIALHHFYSKL